MFDIVTNWAMNASVFPVVLLVTSSVTVVCAALLFATSRKLNKHKREQAVINRRLHEDMASLSKSAIGMGQKVLDTERQLSNVLKKQFAILNSQPEHPSYDQASRLIAMGASESDLVNSCGFSHSEAELLLSLNRKRQPLHQNGQAVH